MVRLTDRPDMTLDVFRGRKTTIQQQQQLLTSFLWTNKGKIIFSCLLIFCEYASTQIILFNGPPCRFTAKVYKVNRIFILEVSYNNNYHRYVYSTSMLRYIFSNECKIAI